MFFMEFNEIYTEILQKAKFEHFDNEELKMNGRTFRNLMTEGMLEIISNITSI